MPKLPIDYSNTTIYKLVKNDDYDNASIYIGSTTDFIRRKNNHKNCCNNEKQKGYKDKKYQYIRDNGGWDNWNMIEIEKFPCSDGNETRAKEEYWRSHFNAQLNSRKAYMTDEEKLEYHKQYREQNKDRIVEYNENNKDKKREQDKLYRINNKDIINEKITCECGCIINKHSLIRHKKRQIHLDLISKINHTNIN